MTNDEILQAAKEAGIEKWWDTPNATNEGYQRALLKMGKIIEKRTIERCAVVAAIGPTEEDWTDDSDYDVGLMMGHRNAAAAIRKLGEQRWSLMDDHVMVTSAKL